LEFYLAAWKKIPWYFHVQLDEVSGGYPAIYLRVKIDGTAVKR